MRISDWSSDVCSSDLIDIKDAIRAIPGSTKLAVCYASQNLSHPFCDDFTRSTLTGEVNYLSAQPINTGRETMSGLDLGLVYNRMIGDVSLSLDANRSEEHTSELQSLMRNSYAVFCLKKKIP